MLRQGRSPCCDKNQVKRGPWSPSEDLRLITFIQKHGHDNWRALPKQAGLLRCGKSCRLRWTNYLRPDLKRGNFTKDEEDCIIKLHEKLGNKWAKIASKFPGRTDNEIKNVWNTHFRKRLAMKNSLNDDQLKPLSPTTLSSSSSSSSSSKDHNNYELPNSTSIQEKLNQNMPPMGVTSHQARVDDNVLDIRKLTTSASSESFPSHASSNGSTFKPEDLVFDFNEANYVPHIDDNAIFELPFEPVDDSFWNILDDTSAVVPIECSPKQTNLMKLVEGGDWRSYLENELGLEDSTLTNSQEIVMKNATVTPEKYREELSEPAEIELDMDDYFGMWHPNFPDNSGN